MLRALAVHPSRLGAGHPTAPELHDALAHRIHDAVAASGHDDRRAGPVDPAELLHDVDGRCRLAVSGGRVGSSSFSRRRISVDLPDPDGPTTKTNSPLPISSETSARALTESLYVLVTLSSLIIGRG